MILLFQPVQAAIIMFQRFFASFFLNSSRQEITLQLIQDAFFLLFVIYLRRR